MIVAVIATICFAKWTNHISYEQGYSKCVSETIDEFDASIDTLQTLYKESISRYNEMCRKIAEYECYKEAHEYNRLKDKE
ncbi:MAG: hypothetical protein NC548_61340 [Lachnospiraceae bacterium]|nr:hypothetical protein [Lachnospiraceae bacterium]